MPTLLRRHFSLRTFAYYLLIIALCSLFLYYFAFQARHILTGPVITLTSESPSIVATSTIILTGTTENIVSLTLNGRPVYTNDAGNFEETLVLPLGYSIMTLTAKDRYGRVHSLERTYVRKQEVVSNQ